MTKEEWLSTIPSAEELTIPRAHAICRAVLSEYRGTTNAIAYAHHGTIPPPPWPAPPSMVKARDEFKKLADGLEVFANRGVQKFGHPFTEKLHARIIELGGKLWDEINALEARWEALKNRTELVKSTARRVAEFATGKGEGALLGGLPTLALVVGGLYVLYRVEKGSRGARSGLASLFR